MWRNNEYKLSLREDSIHEYEKIMLTSGDCGYLLPMVFMGVNDQEIAFYQCGGFCPLSEFRLEKTEDVIYVLEKVLLILSRVPDYLITPSRLTVTEDTVFYNETSGEIKLAYVPLPDEDVNMRKHLVAFVTRLGKEISDGLDAYLEEAAALVGNASFEIRDIVNQLGLLRRKLYSATVQ